MPNTYFQFKKFRIDQEDCAMKVCTDACIFGAWYAGKIGGAENISIGKIHDAEKTSIGKIQVQGRIQHVGNITNVDSILDIGSGTGLLMMMLAQVSSAQIDGIEIEPACFEQLKKNVSQSKWAPRLQVFHGDVRGYTFPLQYDFIISNPPFYDNDLSSGTEGRQTAMHSKELKLDELVQAIVRNLKSTGSAGVLLPYHRAAAFNTIAEKHGLFLCEELRVKQTPKHDWFRFIGRYNFEKVDDVLLSELVIKQDNAYTKEFTELLKAYYLYL